ncbi:putative addiction module antidote protein [Duganella sp. FT109W]|uniref:Addiction module antidote protein n=1 Tax=Duganella margarita TaxID=2692170 RepID=A0ABW9WAK6_9BURK|nr:addiction module antidote protein [Duganella margarita]MYN37993.1 putative addiction module antidote protein [Duganella margarita]
MSTANEIIATDSEFDLDAINSLPEFDAADYIKTEETFLAFVNDFFAEGDPAMIAEALGIAARAKGMTEIANRTGINRESLYKALRGNSQPRLDTIMKVLNAFGLKLVAQPILERTDNQLNL